MYLRNHIAHRFLTDAKMTEEIIKTKYPDDYEFMKKEAPADKETAKKVFDSPAATRYGNLYLAACLPLAASHIPHHAFYITDTVGDNLDNIKTDRKSNGHFDWTVFKNVPGGKTTFIFRDNWLLRFWVVDGVIFFLRISGKEKKMLFGFVDRLDQSVIDPIFDLPGADIVEEQFYKMLLFFYFSKNEERIVEGGKRYGTKKQPDGLDNSSDLPITIVNCNWNITSIRLTGFDVSGHMRLQACGPGMKDHRLTFIQPYKKQGYVRKATNQNINQQAA